jgi:hypothetical protein
MPAPAAAQDASPAPAHGHGPACASIRKIVDFALSPARYDVRLSGTTAASISLLVVPR